MIAEDSTSVKLDGDVHVVSEPLAAVYSGTGFAIFRDYLFQGPVPACYDETNYPVVFATELEAQREIADHQLTRLRELPDRERDFDDAMTTDEFVLAVHIWPDGSISTENGRKYGELD